MRTIDAAKALHPNLATPEGILIAQKDTICIGFYCLDLVHPHLLAPAVLMEEQDEDDTG